MSYYTLTLWRFALRQIYEHNLPAIEFWPYDSQGFELAGLFVDIVATQHRTLIISHRDVSVFGCDQAALWKLLSVRLSVRSSECLSVRPSACYTFFTMFLSSYHHGIFWSYYHGQTWCPCKDQGQRLKIKVTQVKSQFSLIRTVTQVWIHIWW